MSDYEIKNYGGGFMLKVDPFERSSEVFTCFITHNDEKLERLESEGVTWEFVEDEKYRKLAERRAKELAESMMRAR